ncbi:MAG: cysteine peptidase family C39 domain-containing protein, partial [Candidatus Omnitrophota bacterium]
MNINQKHTENNIEQPRKEFQSSFKAWIRAVAFIVIAVFLPEQAAQAMGYDPTTIWNHSYFVHQGKNGFLTYLVADNVKRSLDSLAYKPLNQVQLDKDLVVETMSIQESAGFVSSQDVPTDSLPLVGRAREGVNSPVITSNQDSSVSLRDTPPVSLRGAQRRSNLYGKIANTLQTASAGILRFTVKGLKKISLPGAHSQGLLNFLSRGLTFEHIGQPQGLPLPPSRQGAAASQKPALYITGAETKQINLWLKDPKTQVDNNCGINALNALFVQSGLPTGKAGIKVTREELATRAIMVDFLSGNLREFKGELALSLFALHKTAISFGLKTALVKIPASTIDHRPSTIDFPLPLITYLLSEHFVLVTRITEDQVYYQEDKEELSLSKELFLKGFTGNCLILPSHSWGGSGRGEILPLSDQEALQIMGKENNDSRLRSLKTAIGMAVGVATKNPALGSTIANTNWTSTVSSIQSTVSNARSIYNSAVNVQNTIQQATGLSIGSFTSPLSNINIQSIKSTAGIATAVLTRNPQAGMAVTNSNWTKTISNGLSGIKNTLSEKATWAIDQTIFSSKLRDEKYWSANRIADAKAFHYQFYDAQKQTAMFGGNVYTKEQWDNEWTKKEAHFSSSTLNRYQEHGQAFSSLAIANPGNVVTGTISAVLGYAGTAIYVPSSVSVLAPKVYNFAKWTLQFERGGGSLAKNIWLTSLKYATITGPIYIGIPTQGISSVLYANDYNKAGDIVSSPNRFAGRTIIEGHDLVGGILGWSDRNIFRTGIGDKLWNEQYGKLERVTTAWNKFDKNNEIYWRRTAGDKNYECLIKPVAQTAAITIGTLGVGALYGGSATVLSLSANALRWLPIAVPANIGLNTLSKDWSTGQTPTGYELTSWGIEGVGDAFVFGTLEKAYTGSKIAVNAYRLDRAISQQKYYTPIYKSFTNGRIVTAIDLGKFGYKDIAKLYLFKAGQWLPKTINNLTQSISSRIPELPLPKFFRNTDASLNLGSAGRAGEIASRIWQGTKDAFGAPFRLHRVVKFDSAAAARWSQTSKLGKAKIAARVVAWDGPVFVGKTMAIEVVPRVGFYLGGAGTIDALFILNENKLKTTGELWGNTLGLRATGLNMGLRFKAGGYAVLGNLDQAKHTNELADTMSQISAGGYSGAIAYQFTHPDYKPSLVGSILRIGLAIPFQMIATTEGFAGFPYRVTFTAPYYARSGWDAGGVIGGVKGFVQGGMASPAWGMFGFLTSMPESGVNVVDSVAGSVANAVGIKEKIWGQRIPGELVKSGAILNYIASGIEKHDSFKGFKNFVEPEGHALIRDTEGEYLGADYFFANIWMMGGLRQGLGLKRPEAKDALSKARLPDTSIITAYQRMTGAVLTPMHIVTGPVFGFKNLIVDNTLGKSSFLVTKGWVSPAKDISIGSRIDGYFKQIGAGLTGWTLIPLELSAYKGKDWILPLYLKAANNKYISHIYPKAQLISMVDSFPGALNKFNEMRNQKVSLNTIQGVSPTVTVGGPGGGRVYKIT